MSRINEYLEAADAANTRRSYESAIRHFEVEWKGLLPATTDAIVRYLADHAATHTLNTLHHRLAALSRWHQDQGFPDPTKSPMVRQVLKGIRALHPNPEKRARPLQLEALQKINDWLERCISVAQERNDHLAILRAKRDRAILLLGFWRGFRADELVNLRIEYIEITPGQRLTCYLPRTKGDRQLEGRSFTCPALSRLCPVAAVEAWITCSGLTDGPLFRKITLGGQLGETALHANSLIPMLRKLFAAAGVADSEGYSSHSLRRGFAGWASTNGWDLKQLMEYVGWRDIKSAMRYLDNSDTGLSARFERGLQATEHQPLVPVAMPMQVLPICTLIMVTLNLSRFSPTSRGLSRAQRLIEQTCLERYAMQRLDTEGKRYELRVPGVTREALDDALYTLLDDMHRVAGDNQCFLEASCHDPETDSYWD